METVEVKKFDEKSTAFITVVGEKDADRLGSNNKYFKNFNDSLENLKGYKEEGYFIIAPEK
jgi:hypothetical protein